MIPPVESADKTLQWEKACFVTCYLHLFCNLNIKESKEQKTTKPTFTLINCVVTIIKRAGLYTANLTYTLLFVLLFVNYKLFRNITLLLACSKEMIVILLIIEGCSMLKQTIWTSNHTSHTKLYFNEFVANVLRDNIGIVVFDLRGYVDC